MLCSNSIETNERNNKQSSFMNPIFKKTTTHSPILFRYALFWIIEKVLNKSSHILRFCCRIISYGLCGIPINRQFTNSLNENAEKNQWEKKQSESQLTKSMIFSFLIICLIYYVEKIIIQKHIIQVQNHFIWVMKITNSNDNFRQMETGDIIRGVGLGCESENIDQGTSYSQMNIDISYCFFSRHSRYEGYGGVISVSGAFSISVNSSMFYNCSCSSWGGAIYASCYYQASLRMICANKCYAHYQGHFVYLYIQQINQVELISVSKCFDSASGYSPLYLESGNSRVDNTNSSMNNGNRQSGIFICSPSSFTSSYCTFSNNRVYDWSCIYLQSESGIILMSYANIVHNNSPSWGVVAVSGTGSRKLMNCIFHSNQNYLFCAYGGSLEVSHSFIDHLSSSFSISTAVSTTTNNSFNSRMTYQFQFFNTHLCNADIPLIGKTPVVIMTRSPMKSIDETIQKTPRMTFDRTVDHTMRETPINSPHQTPIITQKESQINTLEETLRETQKETIPRTYVECIFTYQMANWREISVIFSFSFLYPIVILMIS